MRATTFILLLVFAFILFIIIMPIRNSNTIVIEEISLQNDDCVSGTISIPVFEMNPEIPVQNGEFQKMVSFIEEKGSPSSSPCTKRFEFKDASGNNHFLDVIRCSDNDTVEIIHVMVVCNDDESFFYYNINSKKVFLSSIKDPCLPKYRKITKDGFNEFRIQVNLKELYKKQS